MVNVISEDEYIPEEIKSCIDPDTGWIGWESLPRSSRAYHFGPQWLKFVKNSTKLILLMENEMARGGAGHARRLREDAAIELGKLYQGALATEGGLDKKTLEAHKDDEHLVAWNQRHIKFRHKIKIKEKSCGLNIANIPYKAGPEDINKYVDKVLEKDGCIKAIDPWWARDGWYHQGSVTIYVTKEDGKILLDKGAKGELIFAWNDPPMKRTLKVSGGKDGKLVPKAPPKVGDKWD